jgi:hypothetical protein
MVLHLRWWGSVDVKLGNPAAAAAAAHTGSPAAAAAAVVVACALRHATPLGGLLLRGVDLQPEMTEEEALLHC